jgi:hypothetical protein
MKHIKFLNLALILLITGCATSKITTSWKANDITPQKYNRVLVLALINDKDRRIKERMEQHFVGDLTDLGYSAISALQMFGPKAFDSLTEKSALEKIKNSGVDAVVTIVLLDKHKENKYIPAGINYSRDFSGYYDLRRSAVFEPGYYVSDTKYFWESNFYDMGTQQLLYSVQTESFSPKNIESMGHEYGLLIVNSMKNAKILERKKSTD